MLSDQQFDRTRRLALSLAGIELLARHRELLDRRGHRLGILPQGIDELLSAAEKGETSATQRLLGLLTTKFTGFFRHPYQFAFAAEHALRAARQNGMVRLWSAAAATGEEPWSLAMALIEAFQRDEPAAEILATDVDVNALAIAKKGEYGEESVRSVEVARRNRFFVESNMARFSVAPTVRRLVEFRRLNLADVDWPITGPLDVILCRNVLMYLEAGHRYAVLERIASLLVPDGLLLLDPTEHLGTASHWFKPGGDGLYLRRRVASNPQRGAVRERLLTQS